MSEAIEKACELNNLSENFTLSHAVLATAKMIEDQKKSSGSKGYKKNNDEKFLNDYKGNLENLKKEYIEQRIEQINEMTLEKVYISVDNLSTKSTADGARTYYYKRKMLPETETGVTSSSEHFEIVLPPNIPVIDYKNGKISKKSIRFLVGHELGHLWLHLKEIREFLKQRDGANLQGTNLLPSNLELGANEFSFKLSELRDEHMIKTAEFINAKKHAP
ncbi:MAG: ImmA/IrrE family metallo-endopeptidase [Fibromonadaceae bacterium]|nr:ImmA/IrrE family metallo-endopeptidase [Fibromonadaceae bacterium]